MKQEHKRINVDFPAWVVAALDREAARFGVTQESIIKVGLVEHLKAEVGAGRLFSSELLDVWDSDS